MKMPSPRELNAKTNPETASIVLALLALTIALGASTCRFDRSKLSPCTDSSQCNSTLYCDRDAGLCLDRLDAGESCLSSTDCASGTCVDSICCATMCTGACRACSLSGKRGLCAFIPAGQDPGGECAGQANCGGLCDGNGACAYPGGGTVCGATCVGGLYTERRCSSGQCGSEDASSCGLFACNAGGSVCNTACAGHADCNGDAGYCDGGGCQPKKDAGTGCSGAVECVSGSCIGSFCAG